MDQELKVFLVEMKQDLLQHVAASEARLSERLDGHSDRFDGLSARLGRLEARQDTLEANIAERIAASEMRMREHAEMVETRLLGEFWKWARTSEMRFKSLHAVTLGMEERVLFIEERLAELERRRTM